MNDLGSVVVVIPVKNPLFSTYCKFSKTIFIDFLLDTSLCIIWFCWIKFMFFI